MVRALQPALASHAALGQSRTAVRALIEERQRLAARTPRHRIVDIEQGDLGRLVQRQVPGPGDRLPVVEPVEGFEAGGRCDRRGP